MQSAEERKKVAKRWEKRNRKKRKQQRQVWLANNREQRLKYGREYYQRNRERCLQKSRKWNQEHYEYCLANFHRWYYSRGSRSYRRQSELQDYFRNVTFANANEACFEAARLLLRGYSDSEIAKAMKVANRTVKSFIRRLCDEYDVHDGIKRVKLAVRLYQYPIFHPIFRGE